MPATPGRPHEPTIHPRTRPEAEDYALKNRITNDWFRHDGKNVEQLPSKPFRLTTKLANEIATRSKGLTDDWFCHNPNARLDPQPRPRCSEETRDRVYGKEETWDKPDDNQSFSEPPKARVGTQACLEVKTRHEDSGHTMKWYKSAPQEFKPPVPKTGPLDYVTENARKIQGTETIPEWFTYNPMENDRPRSRLTMKEAHEIRSKDRTGTPAEWFAHNPTESPGDMNNDSAPRVASTEAEEIASRIGSESDVWGPGPTGLTPRPFSRYLSEEVKATMEKAKGGDMQKLLRMEGGGGEAQSKKLRPEVEEIVVKSVQGMMKRVMDQAANKDYQSPRPCARAIRPEAQGTFEKNKGVMSDCLQGYPGMPIKKTVHKARPVDDTVLARHFGSSMSKTLKGDLPSANRAKPTRAVKPEGEENAERNRGTIKTCLEDYGRSGPTGVKGRHLMTEEAHAIARKHHGSVDQLIC